MSDIAERLRLGKRLYAEGRLGDAAAVFDGILEESPECADAWDALGTIAIARKEHDRAFEFVSKALALEPDSPFVHQHLAVIYGRLGRFDDAVRHYRNVIRLDPGYAEAYFNLSRIVRFEPGDQFIETLEQRLAIAGLPDADRCFLHFAAGKYYDDVDNPDRAFDHYERANRARNARFDADASRREFASLENTFSQSWLSRHAGVGNPSRLPVFIVGLPRSGTSLVEQILASHRSVAAGGELHYLWQIADTLSRHDPARRAFPECVAAAEPAAFRQLAGQYLQHLAELAPGARQVTNKNPTDFRYLGLVATMFPNARILHVRRDPRDTCLSCYFQNFRNGNEYSFDLQDVGVYYRLYEQLMQHWHTLIPAQLLSVSYEALVTEPEPVVRELLDFCGLDWDPACLEPHKADGAVATASRWQVRRPINRSAMHRWKRYESHIGALLDALGSVPDANAPA